MQPTRNPKFTIHKVTVQTIGDVHLGRVYTNGVPLHMRGKLEAKQRETFTRLLTDSDSDYLVIVGDIFDSFVVDPTDVDFAARSIIKAARHRPNQKLVVMGGNHDESKDLTRKSSFDNLKLMLKESQTPNIRVIEETEVLYPFGFVSWSAKKSAKELVEQLAVQLDATGWDALGAVFVHMDVTLPDNANHYNMIPVDKLKLLTSLVVTGHVHKPDVIERDGLTIVQTGSIVPLAHGEQIDEDNDFYTLTVNEYNSDPQKYAGKAVRFVLSDNEELPEGDFTQVKAYVKPTSNDDDDDTDPDTEDFDLGKVLTKFLTEQELGDVAVASVMERYRQRNVE